jgi:hypothetical protein
MRDMMGMTVIIPGQVGRLVIIFPIKYIMGNTTKGGKVRVYFPEGIESLRSATSAHLPHPGQWLG